ncbi:MAG: 6-phosphofructokinase [Candidatus Eisenbacteria bacterium]
MSRLRIGVLTGGGDVPGLNSCIRALTYRALDDGNEVLGIRRGWAGIVEVDPDDPESRETHTVSLDRRTVRTVDRYGGTFLHTSRTNPAQMRRGKLPERLREQFGDGDPDEKVDIVPAVAENLRRLGLDFVVAIGGDDTLSVAVKLDAIGYPVLAVPKTMDNDVFGTDYCIGFSTAVTRSVNFITDLRTPVGSHERIAIIEVFGRYSGETALFAGYLASVNRTVIAEVPFDPHRLTELLVADKGNNPSHYSICVISEGAKPLAGEMMESGEADAYGHRKLGGIGRWVGDFIRRASGEDVLVQQLAYLMRSGPPDSLDRLVASTSATWSTTGSRPAARAN